MSRDSGAGAYSHGIAWPSPRPQLDVVPADAGTMLDAVSVAMLAIMSPGPPRPCRGCFRKPPAPRPPVAAPCRSAFPGRPPQRRRTGRAMAPGVPWPRIRHRWPSESGDRCRGAAKGRGGRAWRSRSAAVLGDRVGRLAVADVEVVVVAREPGRPPLADQHRIVEVDELDVSGRRRPDQVDQVPGRCPVVCAGAPVRAPCALVLVRADGPDVDVEPVLVGLVPGDVPAVLEADVTDRHPTVAACGECHGRDLELADGISGPPVRPAVADAVVAQVLRGRERGVVEVPDQVVPGDETDVTVGGESHVALEGDDGVPGGRPVDAVDG